ncbi:hypothetical protein FWF48_01385 [Candidatus Saccharibacteria bacterium]|nr:hypothetical protein [Candidatus Saccharibacteria bacterium]
MAGFYTVTMLQRLFHKNLGEETGTIAGLVETAFDGLATDFYGDWFHVFLPITCDPNKRRSITDDLVLKFRAAERLKELGVQCGPDRRLNISSKTIVTPVQFLYLNALTVMKKAGNNGLAAAIDQQFPGGLEKFTSDNFTEYDALEGAEPILEALNRASAAT